MAFGVIIRVICVICGLFLICSVFHFVCCLGFAVSWATPLVGLRRCYSCIFVLFLGEPSGRAERWLISGVFHFVCCLGYGVCWLLGVIIRVICVICGLFLICSVFHFVCCLGYGVCWTLALFFVYILGKPSGKPIRCN